MGGTLKEVEWTTSIEKAEFVFKREFMMMEHNYLCAICKEKSAIMETWNGVLQPCYECQKKWRVLKLNWLDRLFKRGEP